MQNFFTINKVFTEYKSSYSEIQYFIKDFEKELNIKKIVKNINILEDFFICINNDENFKIEKCDDCYLFTFFIYYLLKKKNKNFFYKLFSNYSQLYLSKKFFERSFSVIFLYLKNEEQNIVFSPNECKEYFNKTIEDYKEKTNEVISNLNINLFLLNDNSKKMFLQFISCECSIFSLEQLKGISNFFQNNSLDIFKMISERNNNYINTYFKLIFRFILKSYLLIEQNHQINKLNDKKLIFSYICEIINYSFLYFPKLEKKNLDIEILSTGISSIISKISLIILKNNEINDNNLRFCLDSLENSLLSILKINKKFIKHYSNNLGKIYNIFNNLKDDNYSKKYSQKIIQIYKDYNFVSCELLLIQIGNYNLYLLNNKKSDELIDFGENNKRVNDIFILFEACYISDDIDKDNFNNVLSFFVEKIEFFFLISINNTKNYLGELIEFSKELKEKMLVLFNKKQSIIYNKNFIFVNFLNLIKIILSNEDSDTFYTFLYTFEKINSGEKRANNYFYFLSYFLISQKSFNKINKLLEEIILYKNISIFLIFYSKILYFLFRFEINDNEIHIELTEILFNFYEKLMTKSYFNEYNDIISNTIIPLHLKNLKNSFNQLTVKYIDYLSNNQNEEDSIIYLNELIEQYQNISFCSKKFIKYYNEFSTSKNINNQLYTYHIYLILDFFNKVYDISSDDLLLLITNNNILDERIKDKYQLDFIHYIIFRMIIFKEHFDYMKYAKNNQITAFILQMFKEEIELIDQILNQEKIFFDNNFNETNNKCQFKLINFLYKQFDNNIFDKFLKDYIPLKKDKFLYENFKLKFIFDMNIIGENLKIALLTNNKKYLDINLIIINDYLKVLSEINLNLEKEIEFLKLFKSIYYENNENLIVNLNIISHLNNKDRENQCFNIFYEKIYIIKMCIKYFLKYYKELPKNKIMLDFILNEGINLKLKVSNNNKLNIFEAIIFADIRYYQYIIDNQQKKDINIIKFIENSKTLIGYIENLINQLLKKKNIIDNFSLVEKIKISLILHFLNENTLTNNTLITLIGNFDLHIIIFDLLNYYKKVCLIYFKTLKKYGFCDHIILQIRKFEFYPILKYDSEFYLKILEYIIKIINKWERKFNYEIWADVGNFDSLDEFKSFERKVLLEYINVKYPNIKIEQNDDYNNIIDKHEIYNDYIINKYLCLCENKINKSSSEKVISVYFKNKSKIDNDNDLNELKNLFQKFYPIKDLTSYFITNFRNIQNKYVIKLIPYIYLNDYYNTILIPEFLETFFDIIKGMFKEFKMDWNDYKILKNLKKITKQIIYFSSFLDEKEMTNNIIIFYIKFFHNFKSNILYHNYNKNSVDQIFEKNNIIVTFRIKSKIFLFIKYKTKCAYNSIDTETQEIKEIFKKLKSILNHSRVQKLLVSYVNKMNDNLEKQFFNLENQLICSSQEIKEIIFEIYNENKILRNYLSKKLNEYNINFPIEEIISKLVEPIEQKDDKKKNKKNKKKKILNQKEKEEIKQELINLILKSKSNILSNENIFFYIPSNDLSKIPLENLPLLYNLNILRTITLNYIRENPIDIKISKKNDIFYLLNPSKDLKKTQKTLSPLFEDNQIKGIKENKPEKEEINKILLNKKMYIYIGHGDGTKYVSLDFFKNNKINFLTFLFGCSSANIKMFLGNDTQPYGLPHILLFNNCPFFLGCLWNVSSNDIDYFTLNLFNLIFNNEKYVSLIQSIIQVKKELNLKYSVASSIVFYGNNDINLYVNS